ncbi:IS3 family transposase [Weissella coleopterorum]|uniref:IS3 family transposase n=1 Tax=Weissella coleopterorum TaxID=2714949 RepID=A0A6G8B040_9LACO|nr:IS3 family transposase [Weissella coleopterorum]QIL50493.1 IS3 family transposase [Weissella coleopterorum]
MTTSRKKPRNFDEQFKKQIVKLHESGKSQNYLAKEYGIDVSSITRWIKQYSQVRIDSDTILTAQHNNYVLYQNKLNQSFNPPAPNQAWTSDFTYIPIGNNRSVYLCIVLDLFSRKVIAWHVSAHINTNLAIKTLETAYTIKKPNNHVLIHTDQGSQFTATKYHRLLDQYNLVHSWSKPGYPWDNAVTESFFKYMKKEKLNRKKFTNIESVKLAYFEYIEGSYNSQRPHSALNMLTPNEKESEYFLNN